MPITFHPHPRMVLYCDFDTGFQAPEPVKCRPVIVLSPQARNHQTCIVVPLSTVEPNPIEAFHHRLDVLSLPVSLRDRDSWVKGDMVTTVALHRLDRVLVNARLSGTNTRQYVTHSVTFQDWMAVKGCILVALGLGALKPHL